MPSTAVLALSWAFASYVIYSIVSALLVRRQNAAKARELKCEEPVFQKNRWPMGIDNIVRAIKADKEKLFPVDQIKRTVDVGAITYGFSIFGAPAVFTADEKNIQAVLATQFKDFDLGVRRIGNFWPLLGGGIFTQDGPAWEHSRALMRPQFAREQVSDLDLEERHVQNMLSVLDSQTNTNGWTGLVDLQSLFFKLTLDTATEFLFGESVNSQLHQSSEINSPGGKVNPNDIDFATAFDKGQMALATRARFGDKFWLVNPKGFKQACKDCNDFIDHFVRLALSKELREKELEKDVRGTKEKYVFLEALAAETKDPLELRYQLLHILLAGRDTTASLLGWLFMSLAKDPARYKKLRSAVVEQFGTFEHPAEITFAKLKGCQYLQHCINESLRLYPVVPVNGRQANKDTTIPTGGGRDGKSKIFIPKGTNVEYSVHVMHRRKDIWGQDADEFRPERWEGRRAGWEFLPVSLVSCYRNL